MNQESSKLGRGLSVLLSSKDSALSNSKDFKIVNITSLQPNKEQPRTTFNKNELEELANSIKSKGMLQPIIVRKIANENFLTNLNLQWHSTIFFKLYIRLSLISIYNY